MVAKNHLQTSRKSKWKTSGEPDLKIHGRIVENSPEAVEKLRQAHGDKKPQEIEVKEDELTLGQMIKQLRPVIDAELKKPPQARRVEHIFTKEVCQLLAERYEGNTATWMAKNNPLMTISSTAVYKLFKKHDCVFWSKRKQGKETKKKDQSVDDQGQKMVQVIKAATPPVWLDVPEPTSIEFPPLIHQ